MNPVHVETGQSKPLHSLMSWMVAFEWYDYHTYEQAKMILFIQL